MVKSVVRLFAAIMLALLAASVGFGLWSGWRYDLETDRYPSLCGCGFDEAVKWHGQIHFTLMLLVALSALAASVVLLRWPRAGLLALTIFLCCMALPPWIDTMAPLPAQSVPALRHDATVLPWSGTCLVLSGLCAVAYVHTRRRPPDTRI